MTGWDDFAESYVRAGLADDAVQERARALGWRPRCPHEEAALQSVRDGLKQQSDALGHLSRVVAALLEIDRPDDATVTQEARTS